jgi:hypothetical protein
MNRKLFLPFLLLALIGSMLFLSIKQFHNPEPVGSSLNLELMPIRLPLTNDKSKMEYLDFDKDGDPDALMYKINGDIPVLWIDDDDDMQHEDMEGDMDNDCLCIDKDKDGKFGGPWDFCMDFRDTNNDGIADIQTVIENGDPKIRGEWDWKSNIIWFIDKEKDSQFAYIDWNKILSRGWERNGGSNFHTDYHGQTMFTKMSVSTFRVNDLRYSWENPFLFYDTDGKGYSNMSIRMEEEPIFRNKQDNVVGKKNDKLFEKVDKEIDVLFTGIIDAGFVSFDLDKDAGPANEFDFDMTLMFKGKDGYDYNSYKHPLGGPNGLPEADIFFYDSRWRHLKELIYIDRDSAWSVLFRKGKWDKCWFTFDEDDDCERWERVELYQPLDTFLIGRDKGGIDNNPQADAAGDRGEWDNDNSGNGKLYIGKFDGKFHLFGAEWGAWRIDQNAMSYQGYGGLYENTEPGKRIQEIPVRFPTIKYTDTNKNGFIDLIEFDIDGDQKFESKLSYADYNLNDSSEIINLKNLDFKELNKIYSEMTEKSWANSMNAVKLCKQIGINVNWYGMFMFPKNLQQKYDYAYWLNFYLYRDLKSWAKIQGKENLIKELDKAYLLGDWSQIKIN